MRVPCLLIASALLTSLGGAQGLANGVKLGEVTPESAVLWTRTTAEAEAANRTPLWDPVQPHWTARGMAAQVRFCLLDVVDGKVLQSSPWTQTSGQHDFCHQHRFVGLSPSTTYPVRVEARLAPEARVESLAAELTTAPPANTSDAVRFTVSTCQDFPHRDDPDRGHRIYASMAQLRPAFFVQTGDTLYYDRAEPFAKDPATARYKWNRMYALPYLRDFHRRVPSYWMHDDHDLLKDDCYPGQSYGELTWDHGIEIWKEQVPQSDLPYRTFRWGKDLQIWLPEGRYFRSPNGLEDGPDKTILGEEQWAWLERSLHSSDATFKAYISPTPVVGPDRASKNDNHSNATYAHEGKRLRVLLAATPGAFVINGDRHWQYHSVHAPTGLQEFGCGPASDSHAGGWKAADKRPEHRFLRVAGGFLSVAVNRQEAILVVHDVAGAALYEARLAAPE